MITSADMPASEGYDVFAVDLFGKLIDLRKQTIKPFNMADFPSRIHKANLKE